MGEKRRQRWVPAVVLLGIAYATIGIAFAIPATNVLMWRRTAWVVCAAGYGAHILYERFRLRSSPGAAALHVALAAALGGFGLAVGANARAAFRLPHEGLSELLLIALGAWPVVTAIPAFNAALVANVVLTMVTRGLGSSSEDAPVGQAAPARKLRPPLVAGALLIAISAPTLILMAREMWIGAGVHERYSVVRRDERMPGGALRAEIEGHTVELVDDHPIKVRAPFALDDARAPGTVTVVVDGRPVSTPVPATIRFNQSGANRYWGYVSLMKLIDREVGERVVVAVHIGALYRTVSVFPDGRVVEDTFSYGGRCSPPVRGLLIRDVVPHPSGVCSDVLQAWSSIFYPLLYPLVSGLAGVVCLVVGGVRWTRQRGTPNPLRVE